MKFLIGLILAFQCFHLAGQTFNTNARTSGVMKTTEGSFIGTLDISIELDQVMWHEDNRTRIFGARQIKKVVIDLGEGASQTFVGHVLNGHHYLFEVLSDGKVTILYKVGIVKDQYENTFYPPFFQLNSKKELVPLDSKRDLLAVFDNDSKWMNQYIRNQSLNLENPQDVSRALDYYNEAY
ncbi:MAG: hypothetical protein ACJAVY_000199 [Marinoscillum sp.]|jgi:hypothetical protein